MFDAKSLFEQMVRGANPSAQSPGGGLGDISDLLRQFTQQGPNQPQAAPSQSSDSGWTSGGGAPQASGGSALDELMRQFTQGRDDSSTSSTSQPQGGAGSSGGMSALEELMKQFGQATQGSSGQAGGHQMQELPDSRSGSGSSNSGGQAPGGLGDLLGQMFGQDNNASSSTGAGGASGSSSAQAPNLKDLLEKFGGSGAGANDFMRQLTDFIGNNKVGTGAALGGLGALIFGTQTGRSLAVNAAKLGALAVVGGLAYKAYKNYSQGQPLVAGAEPAEAPPSGSGFEPEQVSNDAAVTYIRAMIAAAAADGRLDANEQQRILGTLAEQGLDAQAEEFLARELNNPASIDELVAGVSNQTEGLQLYTAARVSIEPDTAAEQNFLAVLADRVGLDAGLKAHVDAAARNMT